MSGNTKKPDLSVKELNAEQKLKIPIYPTKADINGAEEGDIYMVQDFHGKRRVVMEDGS